MNVAKIRLYLKTLTENTGNLYSLNLFSDGSGSLRGIRDEEVLSWDCEDEMYLALLSMVTPTHFAKEALINFLGDV